MFAGKRSRMDACVIPPRTLRLTSYAALALRAAGGIGVPGGLCAERRPIVATKTDRA